MSAIPSGSRVDAGLDRWRGLLAGLLRDAGHPIPPSMPWDDPRLLDAAVAHRVYAILADRLDAFQHAGTRDAGLERFCEALRALVRRQVLVEDLQAA